MFMIRFVARTARVVAALVLLVAACGSDPSISDDSGAVAVNDAAEVPTTPADDEASEPPSEDAVGDASTSPSPEAAVLSAYLAIVDTSSPAGLSGLSGCDQQVGDDAMPVVFSVQVDALTVDSSDFLIGTDSGAEYAPTCATLSPADEVDEGYTVLLTGPLGDAVDRPVSISVVGPLASRDGSDLSGLGSDSITDGPGPTLTLAIEADAGAACAAFGSDVEIQTVWQSSVTGSTDTAAAISLIGADGEANPIGFDDDGDSDNHLVLCVPSGHDTTRVDVEAGALSNPAGRANPRSSAEL